MQSQLPLYPEQASNFAPHVDELMIFIIAICLFFAVAVTVAFSPPAGVGDVLVPSHPGRFVELSPAVGFVQPGD